MKGLVSRIVVGMARRSSVTMGLVAFGLVLVAASLLGGNSVLGSSGNKVPNNPEAGLSDSQRQALHNAAHARNSQFLREFVSGGRDPHSLPAIRVETYAAPPLTLASALSAADTIVQGRVRTVTFVDNPSGGMPIATATVDVTRNIKGSTSAVITVQQLGGPVAHGSSGALAEFDTDQLLLPGDEAILMLKAVGEVFHPLPGAGVNLIENGQVEAEASNPFGALFTGRSVDDVLTYVT